MLTIIDCLGHWLGISVFNKLYVSGKTRCKIHKYWHHVSFLQQRIINLNYNTIQYRLLEGMGESVIIYSTTIHSNYISKWNKHFYVVGEVIVNLLCDHSFYFLPAGILRDIIQYYNIVIEHNRHKLTSETHKSLFFYNNDTE